MQTTAPPQFMKHCFLTLFFETKTMSDEHNNPTIVATEYPGGFKVYATNFTAVEDLMETMAYCRASEDSISGAKQKSHVFKSSIKAFYNSILIEQEGGS